jgi:primosomal protein N' (replication factor Y)
MGPVVGGRVLVPFRQQRMSGIVVELHDRPPQVNASQVKIKKVIEALDLSPVLDEQLLKLGKWIADYYLAPVGEVFRTMLPLAAEFKRAIAYRITDEGRMALHLAGMSGSPARSKRTPEQQLVEFRVLDYLDCTRGCFGGSGCSAGGQGRGAAGGRSCKGFASAGRARRPSPHGPCHGARGKEA